MTGRKIFIVENDPVIATLIRWRIGKLGYPVCGTARTGEEAVEYCRQNPPDLLLMDIGLDGSIDGIETAMIIKEKYGLPIVFLTAHTDEEYLERARQAGADAFIRKPFDDDDLRIALKLLL